MLNSYYIGFSALIQMAVAFGFGLLYLTRNKRSIFNDVLKTVSGLIRRNVFFTFFLKYPRYVYRSKFPKRSFPWQKRCRGLLVAFVEVCDSSLSAEVSCRYLSVIGPISAIYSLWWLLFVPMTEHLVSSEDIYLTVSMCTFIVQVIMLLYVIFGNQGGVKLFVISFIYLIGICSLGLLLLSKGYYIPAWLSFDSLFLRSLTIAFMPVIFYCGHLLLGILIRLVVMVLSLLFAFILHFLVIIHVS